MSPILPGAVTVWKRKSWEGVDELPPGAGLPRTVTCDQASPQHLGLQASTSYGVCIKELSGTDRTEDHS